MIVSGADRPDLWIPAQNARWAEQRRRRAVTLVFLVYALSLIEGPLRKWFLPELGTPLIFLRDPFVALIYAYCFNYRLVAWGRMGYLWLAMAIASSLLGLVQYLFNELNTYAWFLGVRTYWLYMPLAFVVGASFQRADVDRFLLLNMLLAIPYAALVAAQYSAGPAAWINLGVGGDDEAAVGVAGDIVRPFGLFTYTGPNVQFTAAMVAMFLAFFLSGARVPFRTPLLWAAGTAVGTMSVLTGSRGIYFLAAAIVAVTLVGSTIAHPDARTLMRNAGVLVFVAVAGALFSVAFPDMFAAMAIRFEVAEASEGSIWDRALGMVWEFADPLFTAPLLGHGIGVGAPGVVGYLGLPPLLYGEGDLQRNINELGVILGSAFIVLRFSTAVWLLGASVRLARSATPVGLPLAGYAMLAIAIGQITNSPLNAFLPWLLVGLLMAAMRTPYPANRAMAVHN
jgi:hypothetical protein